MTKRNTRLYAVKGGKGKKKKDRKKSRENRGSRNRADVRAALKENEGLLLLLGIVLLSLLVAGAGVMYALTAYRVKDVYVEGNIHYSDAEIRDMVMAGPLGDNSLYLSLKYHGKKIKDIPFIQSMSVRVQSPTSIKISVYEKALAGYAAHLENYIYFDRDGIVVETSDQRSANVPQVYGLEFDHVIMHERLPVEDPVIFEDILRITQLMEKYGVFSDAIYFDKAGGLILYYGDAKVSLGDRDRLDEKMMKLKPILPEITGLKGTLRMDNYSEDMQNITFEKED